MADNTVRFGVLGCVKPAAKFVKTVSLSHNAVITAVGDQSLEKAEGFAASNGLPPETVAVYESCDQLLDDTSVDAVYVAVPVAERSRWAVAAAEKKKHLVVEKPPARDAAELDRVLEACKSNGVQFMDGTIWLHHQRTARIKETMFRSGVLGDVRFIYSSMTSSVPEQVLDKLTPQTIGPTGAVGELGWYPFGAVLWAMDYRLPTAVRALPFSVVANSAGAILSCSASLVFSQSGDQPQTGTTTTTTTATTNASATATAHLSFQSHLSTDLTITGSKGSVRMDDYVIPFKEDFAWFEYTSGADFVDMHVGWNMKPEKVTVDCGELSQEVLMLQEFVRLVDGIKRRRSEADWRWPEISRKTQLVVDAVKKSVDEGCKIVYL